MQFRVQRRKALLLGVRDGGRHHCIGGVHTSIPSCPPHTHTYAPARDLAAKDWAGTSDPYVQLQYDGRAYRTRTVYNTTRPVWNRTFVLPENPGLLTRRWVQGCRFRRCVQETVGAGGVKQLGGGLLHTLPPPMMRRRAATLLQPHQMHP